MYEVAVIIYVNFMQIQHIFHSKTYDHLNYFILQKLVFRWWLM